jgi:toxin-antitoxin system PIN domain toxin
VIAVDTNILVYAFNEDAPQHDRARQIVRALAEGDAAWALPVFVIGEFLRVVTNPRGPLTRPGKPASAMQAIDALLASPSVRALLPGRRYLPLLRGLVADANPKGNEIFDAQVAAVCLEHGATTILTEDRDFLRFSGVTVQALG